MLQHFTIFCNFAQILQDSARFHRIPIGTTKFHYILQFSTRRFWLIHIWAKDIWVKDIWDKEILAKFTIKVTLWLKTFQSPQFLFSFSWKTIKIWPQFLWLKHHFGWNISQNVFGKNFVVPNFSGQKVHGSKVSLPTVKQPRVVPPNKLNDWECVI